MTGRGSSRYGTATVGVAARSDQGRIAELRAKIGDDAYMAGAILRIATVLSARLTEGYIDGGRKAR